ncbi:UDP-N-acetylglucosamine 2-epimerase (non-hydrolyzing) [Zunongwangia sp. F363]|uniref:UDP-N-acetylglucosamine 2-epimerase (non-hydrolyzing) n=1 Tax=Autumnicola tepida TaxID=3075595 RepID=A0ABU3C9N0_9FLAO|nr:UDP-N-acetylglucosamine 2-epimerase (non-hydrolyzing) [Zunongwangia sp. F363]MDT0643044.1 UDP-N-acetylglucosamine 2-epimerase (non-hydrolyzing) [Zunongwangia sp. F363]
MKYLFCFGTRPEVIKLAPVIKEMQQENLAPVLCVTGQHREMLDQMLSVLDLSPDYDLDLMKAGQSLNSLSASIFENFDSILKKENPDVVLVQGDTTTATIIAQSAFHRKIKIAHVEAGLRTYQRYSPFPEEINRQLISRIATWHFTPTLNATQNLLKEGIEPENILQTGNTVVDALELVSNQISEEIPLPGLKADFYNYQKKILVTGHRRENFGKGMEELCQALIEISKNKDFKIIFPVHLNPKTKLIVEKHLKGISNINLLPPVNYTEMIWLIAHCDLIISDSGGVQEEAPTFKKPVLVTREFTERVEAVEAGFSILTGANAENIVSHALRLLKTPPDFSNISNPFGDGKAAERIVDFLESQVSTG